jgi:hypothetical protein
VTAGEGLTERTDDTATPNHSRVRVAGTPRLGLPFILVLLPKLGEHTIQLFGGLDLLITDLRVVLPKESERRRKTKRVNDEKAAAKIETPRGD